MITLPLAGAALGVAGHPVGCTALLLYLLRFCCISPREPWPEPVLGTGSRHPVKGMNQAGAWAKTDLIWGTFPSNSESPVRTPGVSWVIRSLLDTGHLTMFSMPMSDFLWLDLPSNVLELCSHKKHPLLIDLFSSIENVFFQISLETVGTAPR